MVRQILLQVDWTQVALGLSTAIGSFLLWWYRERFSRIRVFWREVFNGLRSLPQLSQDVKGIRYYVGPNGGGSMMDSLTRLENSVGDMRDQLDMVVETMRAENDTDETVAYFHSDADGAHRYVSQSYARWLGVGKSELLGWNFLNFIAGGDVEAVREHWSVCRAEGRRYQQRYRLVPVIGEPFEVDVMATPIPEGEIPPRRWVGVIRKVTEDA